MEKIETELIKEMKLLRKSVDLMLKRQELLLKVLIPEVRPTKEELKIIKRKKEFGEEKELFEALR